MPHYESAKGQLQMKLFENNEGDMTELFYLHSFKTGKHSEKHGDIFVTLSFLQI